MKRHVTYGGLALLASSALPTLASAAGEKTGMPQLDPSTYASQLFWLAVFFVLFYLFMWRIAMPRVGGIIARRQAQVSGDLGRATAASGDAQRLERELNTSLSSAREQARSTILSATEDLRARNATQEAELAQELAQKIETAEAGIRAQRNAALGVVESIATGIVQEALPKLTSVDVDYKEAARAVSHVDLKKA